jgi:predicted ester cyclase
MVRTAFPDFQLVPEQIIAESDFVAAFVTAAGTHRGEFLGIPATNKSISVSVSDLMRVQNGKVTEHWGVTDNAKLLQQLGVG